MVDREGVIHSNCVSKGYIKDGSRVNHLLDKIEDPVSSFTGDKGYDQVSVYRAVNRKSREAEIIIHPRSNTVISEKGKWKTATDMFRRYSMMEYVLGGGTLGTINKVGWRTQSIDTKQSLEEN